AEHLLGLAGVDFGGELVEPRRQIVGDRLTRLRPLREDGQIVDAPLERIAQRAIPFDRLAPLQDLLRRGLIFPEVGVGDALLYLRELVGSLRGVKDSSADRTRVGSGPGIGGAVRRVEVSPCQCQMPNANCRTSILPCAATPAAPPA